MRPDELSSLRTTYRRFLDDVDHPDIEQVARGVKRLTAFLVGCGAASAHIEEATRDFVDTCFKAGEPLAG